MAKEKYLLIGILLLGLVLRLINLGQSFWLDEASQAQMSALSISQIWFERQRFSPSLVLFLSHYWMQVNQSEIWLRLLPVSFGIISVGLIYFINRKIGLIAAFFLAINPYHIITLRNLEAILCLLCLDCFPCF